MKALQACLICIAARITFLTPMAYAGWSEDSRLTDVIFALDPHVLSRNDTVHVVYQHSIEDEIRYLRSCDGGDNWDSTIVLTEPNHASIYPDLSLSDNGLLVSWQDDGPNDEETIAIRTSIEGSDWQPAIYVPTDNMHHFTLPASTVKGDSIFIVYRSYRVDPTGGRPFRFMYSYDYGMNWSDESSIGCAPSNVQDLLISYCDGMLVAAWAGFPDTVHAGYHVIGYSSSDAGQTWSDSIWISPHSQYSAQDACIACNEETGEIAVGYMDYRYQEYAFHGDIFIAISDDGGLTWPREIMATENHAAWDPSIDFQGDTLVVVWSDRQFYDEGEHEIMFNRSNDEGIAWQGEYRLTDVMGESLAPWISMDDSKLQVVWNEYDREGSPGSEVFHKRYTPDPTFIQDSEEILPAIFEISTYPNPFNSALAIVVKASDDGVVSIYDVLGRVIAEFDYESGLNLIQWDATDAVGNKISSGIYFAKARAPHKSNTIKLIYLK